MDFQADLNPQLFFKLGIEKFCEEKGGIREPNSSKYPSIFTTLEIREIPLIFGIGIIVPYVVEHSTQSESVTPSPRVQKLIREGELEKVPS